MTGRNGYTTSALAALLAFGAASLAGAAAYCPPKGKGAPRYCENIPHKGKKPARKKASAPPATPDAPMPKR